MKTKNIVSSTNKNIILSDSKNLRILIVEKNPIDAAIAEKILELLNYPKPVVTNSGKEAIKLFNTLSFDMVILGTDLPDLNELEVCHQLRMLSADRKLSIIAYTAFGEERKSEMLNTVFDDFLFKIMGFDDFASVIEKCIIYNGRTIE